MTCTINGNTNGLCPQYTFNQANNQITSPGFTYDAAGNLTGDGTYNYQYDAENRLISLDSGSEGGYTYNALGLWVGGGLASMLYDPFEHWIADADTGGNLWVQVVPGPENPHMALYSYLNDTFFAHPNALDSSTMGTDASGNVTQDLLFYPWGQLWQTAGNVTEVHFAGFMGFNTALGLHSATYRQYAAGKGRWMTPDPLGGDISNPQSLNRYAYVLNNPETLTDPLGLCPWGACSHIMAPGGEMMIPGGLDEFDFIEFGGGPILTGTPAPAGNCAAEFVNCVQTLGGTVGLNGAGQAEGLDGPFYANGEFAGEDAINYFLLSFGSFGADSGGGAGGAGGGPISPAGCGGKILGAVNNQFGTNFTSANVEGEFQYSNGAPPGQGTFNLNISVPLQDQPDGVSPGRYPVNWWAYITGYGSTLHVPGGPGGLDSPSTLIFSNGQFTAHLDSAFPYNPFGLVIHGLNVLGIGGHNPCP